ncbi:MAG: transketolase [Deltaproteobacteria bacterium]|nr:transketolase [Deltaproteobacteria bacterium]
MLTGAATTLSSMARRVRRETLKIHKTAPGTRIASSLSCVEIFVALYYGNVLAFDAHRPGWEGRDRLIISKGHGAISLYPILADIGYFDASELSKVCKEGSFLGGIPDCVIPGFETINGSLGHGPGVAVGMAIALKRRRNEATVFVLLGDGELYEGAVWEAIMFAGGHELDNLVMILDNNKACMLDFCKNILDMEPLAEKFRAFRWTVQTVDGHDAGALAASLAALKADRSGKPKILIADTVKGKGAPSLEGDPLSHIKNLSAAEVDSLAAGLE